MIRGMFPQPPHPFHLPHPPPPTLPRMPSQLLTLWVRETAGDAWGEIATHPRTSPECPHFRKPSTVFVTHTTVHEMQRGCGRTSWPDATKQKLEKPDRMNKLWLRLITSNRRKQLSSPAKTQALFRHQTKPQPERGLKKSAESRIRLWVLLTLSRRQARPNPSPTAK